MNSTLIVTIITFIIKVIVRNNAVFVILIMNILDQAIQPIITKEMNFSVMIRQDYQQVK